MVFCAETGTDLGANEDRLRKTKELDGDEAEDVFAETNVAQELNKEGTLVHAPKNPGRFFDVKVKKVNILEDLMQSAFWKAQKIEKMNLIGTEGVEVNF